MTKTSLRKSNPVSFKNSLQWRIVAWIIVAVAVALTAVVVMTRGVLVAQVKDDANSDVAQELEEFRQFATTGLDPQTGEPYDSGAALIQTYMERQIPDDEELFIGRTQHQIIQHDFSSLDSVEGYPDPLSTDDPLVEEIFGSEDPSGIYKHPERGRIHWGRVEVVAGEGDPAQFAVLNLTQRDLDAANQQARLLTLLALGGLAASGLIAWWISGQITSPLRKLQSVAAQITNSDLTQRVQVDSDNEVGHLAHTFNDMLDRIESAYIKQRQFVDDAGHELRTPITVVRGQLELLESSDEEERKRSVELATAELDRMSRMVNDMLTLAVADSGDLVDPVPVDVTALALDIEEKALTMSDRIRLVDVAEGTVVLDEHRVTEAALELCSNALRYSEEHVEIGTDFRGEGDQRIFRLWVRDRGMGIPAEKQEVVFDRFRRDEQTQTARPAGAGLGLSIVDAIGQAHGGRAYVESTVGLGSVFGLEIPAPPMDEENVKEDSEQS